MDKRREDKRVVILKRLVQGDLDYWETLDELNKLEGVEVGVEELESKLHEFNAAQPVFAEESAFSTLCGIRLLARLFLSHYKITKGVAR